MVRSETEPNRLIHEKSPYLLQHAYNPVDWYPWGEEAFEKARKEDKPIFLSIGYSTCHWCHVMEEESFSKPEIAKIMNETVVAIKVDREERPDVDHIYMQAVMAMTGSGGWPLSAFLTPDLKPFYGGTYFPPEDRWGRPGFATLLKEIAGKWKTDREKILKSSDELTKALRAHMESQTAQAETLDERTLKTAYHELGSRYDQEKGGFGSAPKFPQSYIHSFLLRYWKRSNAQDALEMADKTLTEMARGGMYDHIGGGFHRYSTDREWFVPHFEKMLYDQAILSKSYLEAYQATGHEDFARVAREIFDYVLRDMQSLEGGFYSAEDADSFPPEAVEPTKKSEGAFYLWYEADLIHHLGTEDAKIFNYYFGVESHGNVENDPHREFSGKNILFAAHTLGETAQKFGKSEGEIRKIITDARNKLLEIRSKRPRPHLDDKILADWNGLMISSLAFGARVLGEDRYRDAAQRSADFILAKVKREDGRLMHRYREGEVSVTGFLEDYAFFTHGLIDLYEATFDPKYLTEAQFLAKDMFRLFWDESGGGFFFTGKDAEKLISRVKEAADGAIPSGNSVAALSLLRLGRMTMDREMETWANSTVEAFSAQLAQFPSGFGQMMIALDFAIGPSQEIVIAGDGDSALTQEMIRTIYSMFLPSKVVVFHPLDAADAESIRKLSPFVQEQVALGGKPTAYVCRNYMCEFPTSDISKLRKLLS
ncbi:MAG: hypothetical protein A3G87_03450 [Omnitrophica bacterium RIFCSPLOWO2_12_FULL_50_11]|nr:MAG: hypothetical protein A3G87_03450 [Omnitrophica bacterium RIFCSPLOWO2_12_FULL_50_11]